MIKQFLKDSAWYSFGNVANKVLQVCMVPFFARVLSPANYGVLEMLMVVTTLVNTTIALEIHQAISRFFPELDDEKRRRYMSTAIIFSLLVYMFFGILALFFWRDANIWLFDGIATYKMYGLMLLSIVSTYSFSFINNQLRWLLMAKENVLCNIANSFCTLTVSFALVIVLGAGVSGMFIGTIVGNCVATAMSAFYGRRYISIDFSYEYLKQMLDFSYPAAISSACIIFGNFIDRIFIKEYMNLEELGIYGMAYKIAGVTSIIITGIQSSLMPLVYRGYRDDSTKDGIATIFRWVVFFLLLFFLFIGVFADNIVSIFLGDQFKNASSIAPMLVIAVIMSNLYIFAPGMHIAKKTKTITIINILVTAISIFLNFLLIPKFGLQGAALANVVRAIVFCYMFFFISFKMYPIYYDWQRIIGGAVLSLAIYMCTVRYIVVYDLLVQIILYMVSIVILLTVFITPEDIAVIKNAKKYFC